MYFHVIHYKWHEEYFIVYFSPESVEVKWVLHVVPNGNADRDKAKKMQ